MAYFNFENGKTALNDTNLKAMQKGLMELVFPIGSTYITQTDTNPSTILEFGTWERFKGVLAVGLDEDDSDKYFNEIGKKGGEKKHTMTVDEIAEHTHSFRMGGSTYSQEDNHSSIVAKTVEGAQIPLEDWGGKYKYHTDANQVAGKGQSFNVTQPYEVVGYMWIRRA